MVDYVALGAPHKDYSGWIWADFEAIDVLHYQKHFKDRPPWMEALNYKKWLFVHV